jgi:hypothetical protein
LVCLLIFKIYPEWKENYIIKEQKENKEVTIKNFKGNKNIFDNLVKRVYSRDKDININFSDRGIEFLVDNKKEKLDDDYCNLLNRIHTLLQCERIRLYKGSSGNNILKIYIKDGGVYSDSIIYGKNIDKDMDKGITQISPEWHYQTLWYT